MSDSAYPFPIISTGSPRIRYHAVQEFNKGVYDYIIATDESGRGEQDDDDRDVNAVTVGAEAEECKSILESFHSAPTLTKFTSVLSTQREPAPEHEADAGSSEPEASTSKKRKRPSTPPPSKSRKRKTRKDAEYGVTRGIDFIDVACVLNFDLPTSSRSYTHRVGRTARAGRTGMSLSFIVPSDEFGKDKVIGCVVGTEKDEEVWERIQKEQAARGSKVKDYTFDMKQVEAFRYRMEDALRSVTKVAVKEARVKELKQELLNSDKLKVRLCFSRFSYIASGRSSTSVGPL